jgi:uncharacterized HAD superfamily protein
MKHDFMQTVDFIFKNKEHYIKLTDKDKHDNFFMVNRKFALKYLSQAQLLNSKYIDRASAVDMWNYLFRKIGTIPGWYWTKSPFNKEKTKDKKISKKERELLLTHNPRLKEEDLLFLIQYYPSEVEYELKKLKRFDE